MKTTKYFDFRRVQPDRFGILDEWIQMTLDNPEVTEIQQDGRKKHWRRIPEAGNRYPRVVVLDDEETVHNAFFDRDFKTRR